MLSPTVTAATTPNSKFLSLRVPAIDQHDQLSFLRQHDQLAFIRALTPFFQTAYELGELHRFYEMVLTMWFDVWPELSQNPLTQQHNRFVRFSVSTPFSNSLMICHLGYFDACDR